MSGQKSFKLFGSNFENFRGQKFISKLTDLYTYHLDYENHEQSQQKLGTFSENKVFRRSNFSKNFNDESSGQFSFFKKYSDDF